MAEKKAFSNMRQKTALSEHLWLLYFNSYLYKKGMLTETERNRMISKIDSRKGSVSDCRQK